MQPQRSTAPHLTHVVLTQTDCQNQVSSGSEDLDPSCTANIYHNGQMPPGKNSASEPPESATITQQGIMNNWSEVVKPSSRGQLQNVHTTNGLAGVHRNHKDVTRDHSCLSSPFKRRTTSTEARESLRVTFAEENNQYVTLGSLASPEVCHFVEDDEDEGLACDDGCDSLLAPPGSVKRSSSTESRDNPFLTDGELCRTADYILANSTIQRGRLIIADPDTSVTLPPETIANSPEKIRSKVTDQLSNSTEEHASDVPNITNEVTWHNTTITPVVDKHNSSNKMSCNVLSSSFSYTHPAEEHNFDVRSRDVIVTCSRRDTSMATVNVISRVDVCRQNTSVYLITDCPSVTTVRVSHRDNTDVCSSIDSDDVLDVNGSEQALQKLGGDTVSADITKRHRQCCFIQ